MLVLRLLVGANIIIKQEAELDWEWSTAFWPYWCSFTVQAILIIATAVIFFNTISLYLRGEALMFDLLGSLWGFLMATGFMLSTLQPVIEIIRIFDVGRNIPDKFFNDSLPPDRFEIERKWLTDQE